MWQAPNPAMYTAGIVVKIYLMGGVGGNQGCVWKEYRKLDSFQIELHITLILPRLVA